MPKLSKKRLVWAAWNFACSSAMCTSAKLEKWSPKKGGAGKINASKKTPKKKTNSSPSHHTHPREKKCFYKTIATVKGRKKKLGRETSSRTSKSRAHSSGVLALGLILFPGNTHTHTHTHTHIHTHVHPNTRDKNRFKKNCKSAGTEKSFSKEMSSRRSKSRAHSSGVLFLWLILFLGNTDALDTIEGDRIKIQKI